MTADSPPDPRYDTRSTLDLRIMAIAHQIYGERSQGIDHSAADTERADAAMRAWRAETAELQRQHDASMERLRSLAQESG